jgi:hypothetical protein
VEQKKKSSMLGLLQNFAMQHFASIFSKLSVDHQKEFLNIVMAVVHSHRHNKEDTRSNI